MKRVDEQIPDPTYPGNFCYRNGIEYPIYGDGDEIIGKERFVTETRLVNGKIQRGKMFASFDEEGNLLGFSKHGYWYEESAGSLFRNQSNEIRWGLYEHGRRTGVWEFLSISHDVLRFGYHEYVDGWAVGKTTEYNGDWINLISYEDYKKIGLSYSFNMKNNYEKISYWDYGEKIWAIEVQTSEGQSFDFADFHFSGYRLIKLISSIEDHQLPPSLTLNEYVDNGWENQVFVNEKGEKQGIAYAFHPEGWWNAISYKNNMKEGPATQSQWNGFLAHGYYSNNRKHGVWIFSHRNGSYYKQHFVDGIREGDAIEYLPSIRWRNTGKYRNNLKHGWWHGKHDFGYTRWRYFREGVEIEGAGLRTISARPQETFHNPSKPTED